MVTPSRTRLINIAFAFAVPITMAFLVILQAFASLSNTPETFLTDLGSWQVDGSVVWDAEGTNAGSMSNPGSAHLLGGKMSMDFLADYGYQRVPFHIKYMGEPVYYRILDTTGQVVIHERVFGGDPGDPDGFSCIDSSPPVVGQWYDCPSLTTVEINAGSKRLEFESVNAHIDMVSKPNKVLISWPPDGGGGGDGTPDGNTTPVSISTSTPTPGPTPTPFPQPGIYYVVDGYTTLPRTCYSKEFTQAGCYPIEWSYTSGRCGAGRSCRGGFNFTSPAYDKPIYGYVFDWSCAKSRDGSVTGCGLNLVPGASANDGSTRVVGCLLPQDIAPELEASLNCDAVTYSTVIATTNFNGHASRTVYTGISQRQSLALGGLHIYDFKVLTGIPIPPEPPAPDPDTGGYGANCSITITETGTISGTATPGPTITPGPTPTDVAGGGGSGAGGPITPTNPITYITTISASLLFNGSFEDGVSGGINPLPPDPWSPVTDWYLIGPASEAITYSWRYAADGEYSLWRQGEGSSNQQASQICQTVSIPGYVRFLRAGFSVIPSEAGTGSRTVSISAFGHPVLDYEVSHSLDPFSDRWVTIEETIDLTSMSNGTTYGMICIEVDQALSGLYVDKVYAYALDGEQALLCPDPSDPEWTAPPAPTPTPDPCGPRDPSCTTPTPTVNPFPSGTPISIDPNVTPIALPTFGPLPTVPVLLLTPDATRCFGWEDASVPGITVTLPGQEFCVEMTTFEFTEDHEDENVRAIARGGFGFSLTSWIFVVASAVFGLTLIAWVRQR